MATDNYRGFASIYDALMYDVDYQGLVDYIDGLVPVEGAKVLDLGCGTGSVMAILESRGATVRGMDLSRDMTALAAAKCPGSLVVTGDMRLRESYLQLPVEGGYDLVLSMLDCLNYLPEEQDLLATFENAYEALAPGGHMLFDMNTEYKLSQVLGDNFYYDLGEDECYLWENEYDPDRGVCRFDLTFFAKEPDGRYSRIDEVHREYAYNTDRVVELLRQAGFAHVTTYGDRQMSAPREREERVFFLARKQ